MLENENILGWLLDDAAVHWLFLPVVVEFENNIGWFIEGVELVEDKNQLDLLPELALVFENEKSTGWPPDDFAPGEQGNQLDLLHEDGFVLGNENQPCCSLLEDVTFEKENKFCWHPEFDVVLVGEKQSGSPISGIVVPTWESKFGCLSVDVVGSDNENRLGGLANDFGGPAGGKIFCWSYDTTLLFENEGKHEWVAGDLVLLNDIKPLGWLAWPTVELEGEINIGWPPDTVVVLEKDNDFDWLPEGTALLTGKNKLTWLVDVIAVREEKNVPDWFFDVVVVLKNDNKLVWFLVGVAALGGVNETNRFSKEAEVLENEKILGWLLNNVALHWSLFLVLVAFENNIGWFNEGAKLLEGKSKLGLLSDHVRVFENEKNTSCSSDDFGPLERGNQSHLLHEDAFVIGNVNEFSCSFLDNVVFEKENEFGRVFDVLVKREKQSGSLLDGIVVPTCEKKFDWSFDDVIGSDNEERFWGLANDFGEIAGRNVVGWSHDITVVLEDEDKLEWMANDLVLLNDLKPLGWLACTIAELEGERNIGWLADTVVMLGNEDNFEWLPDDIPLLTDENKLVWLHNAIAAREEWNELSWVIEVAVFFENNLDWLSHNDVVLENKNNPGWLSHDIVLSLVSEDATILGNKGNLDWIADDVVVLTSTPGTVAAKVTVFENE